MQVLDIPKLRELATTLREDLSLKGPWRWAGNFDGGGNGNLRLCTRHGGQMFVMTFTRAGMRGAQPMFPQKKDDSRWSVMAPAKEMPVFEVAPTATDRSDERVYRGDLIGFRNPVAEYLAAVDADTVLALLDRIAELEQQVAS